MLCLSQKENNYWKSTAIPVTEFRINFVLDIQMRIITLFRMTLYLLVLSYC